MLDYLYLGLYKLFGFLLWILPDALIRVLMKGLAWLAYTVSARRRHIIHANLDLAFDNSLNNEEKKHIGISAFTNLIDTIFGLIKRDRININKMMKNIIFEGEEIVQRYQAEGKRFMFISGHYGNWEMTAPAIAKKFNLTSVVVGRKLDSDMMDEVLKKNRERFNIEMIYKKGAMKGCIKAINQGKIVGILIDQSIGQNQSIEVDFFGVKATHTPLASILSRKFGLDVIPAFISTEDYVNYKVKIYEPIKAIKTDDQEDDLAKLTQAQADVMQLVIEENPKQWFWMHKRWKELNSEIYNQR